MTIYDQIESALDLMTDLEREIACYFMGQPISKDALLPLSLSNYTFHKQP